MEPKQFVQYSEASLSQGLLMYRNQQSCYHGECLVGFCASLGGYGCNNCHVCLRMCCVCIILRKCETTTSQPKYILLSLSSSSQVQLHFHPRFNAACM